MRRRGRTSRVDVLTPSPSLLALLSPPADCVIAGDCAVIDALVEGRASVLAALWVPETSRTAVDLPTRDRRCPGMIHRWR
jgi:hypothetical protein